MSEEPKPDAQPERPERPARRYVVSPPIDPRKAPPVPPAVDRYLEQLDGLHPETRAYLKFLFPSEQEQAAAQRLEQERQQTERVERLRHLSELARGALDGRYGAVIRAAVRQVLADQSIDRAEQLEQCGRIIDKQRAEEAKNQRPERGKYAP